jgi:hypothetical protein
MPPKGVVLLPKVNLVALVNEAASSKFPSFLSKHTSSSNKAAWGSLKLCSSYKRLCRNHLEDSGDMELLQEEGLAASRPLPLTTLSSAMI